MRKELMVIQTHEKVNGDRFMKNIDGDTDPWKKVIGDNPWKTINGDTDLWKTVNGDTDPWTKS